MHGSALKISIEAGGSLPSQGDVYDSQRNNDDENGDD